MTLFTNAIAAISKSFGPIGVPNFSNRARIWPYLSALLSSKGNEAKRFRKLCWAARFFSGFLKTFCFFD